MFSTAALVLAGLFDWLFGDPRWMPHPVRLLGSLISILETNIRKYFIKPLTLKITGIVMALLICGGSALIVFLIISIAYRFHIAAGFIAETYIYYISLAGGDLRNHLRGVEEALIKGNISDGREATAMLVSRDTDNLDQQDLARAALESLYENSSDGLVAPLFYAALAGPAGIVFYKAASTLDSMVGYKNSAYYYLGWFSAKLDDLLNYLPARLTAILIIVVGCGSGKSMSAFRVLKNNHNKHDSPNSAWPEAAAAGIMDVRFGGPDYYGGRLVEHALINPGGKIVTPSMIRPGLYLYYRTVLLAYLIMITVAWLLRTLEVPIF